MTQQEYDLLPGTGAASVLNARGSDGQPILKYAQSNLKSGEKGITHYWIDDNGKQWRASIIFIPDDDHIIKFDKIKNKL